MDDLDAPSSAAAASRPTFELTDCGSSCFFLEPNRDPKKPGSFSFSFSIPNLKSKKRVSERERERERESNKQKNKQTKKDRCEVFYSIFVILVIKVLIIDIKHLINYIICYNFLYCFI